MELYQIILLVVVYFAIGITLWLTVLKSWKGDEGAAITLWPFALVAFFVMGLVLYVFGPFNTYMDRLSTRINHKLHRNKESIRST